MAFQTFSSRPDRQEILMKTAQLFALRSTCSRAHVGAVFSRDGRILSTGYNGAPARMPHCDHGILPTYAGAQEGCRVAVHAEANGIAWAARLGVALELSELHTTRAPCVACAQLIINAGVGHVTWLEPHRDMAGVELLESAGVHCLHWEPFP